MLNKDGIATREQIFGVFPKEEVLIRPKAIIECFENIPCNPCSTSCPHQAITIGEDINELPKVDFDACTGCGICVYSCPGLAIKVASVSGNFATFKIPYEFLPYPKVDEIWDAVDRKGNILGDAKIEKITITPKQDKTALVQVTVDRKFLYEFAGIRRRTV